MGDQTTNTNPTPTAPAGGIPTTPPAGDPPAPTPPAGEPQTPSTTDEPLGEAGLRALQSERQRVKDLEDKLKGLEPLNNLVEAIRGGQHVPDDDKTEVEKLAAQIEQLQQTAESERLARLRIEVATAAGLTPQQAARLQGNNAEELAADAAALKELFGVAPEDPAAPAAQGGPRRPAPDPTQGARGPVDLSAQIKAAEEKGDLTEVIRLKTQQLTSQ
ncbi:hypothetical protein [Glycomyces tarimensis]